MVARRSPSDSADSSNEEALRQALVDREEEVEELRARLTELVATGRDFLSDAAHAIRSPLTVTNSYLEMLRTDLTEGLTDEQRSFLGIAYENALKLRRLVDDLVDLAALEIGNAQIELAPVAVGEIIDGICGDLLPTAERKGLELTTEVPEFLPSVTVDNDRFRDVLRRLLDNAMRFTPDGGAVRIRASHDQDHVAVRIVDNGVGIPADRVTETMEPFVQLHRKPGENREGYGLGLPLCQRQIEAFGGTLDIESAEGEGTTVTIRIPHSTDADV
jgi:signal transduction histidine kinase